MFSSAIKILDKAATNFAEKAAIEDNQNSYTYSEYRNYAKKIASYILNKNKNGFIGVFLPKSCNTLISFMGILYSGSTYVPFDINMPSARLSKIISHLKPSAIITDSAGSERLKKDTDLSDAEIIIFDTALGCPVDENLIENSLMSIIDTDPIYIMYTSGSTGMPKGVVIPHKGVIDYAHWVVNKFDLNENTIFGNQAPFHFDNSILDIYGAMLCGGKVIIIPEVLFNFPVKLPEYIEQKNINLIFWVPTVLINVANSGILSEIKFKSLKKVLFCGEVMPNKQLNIWRKTQSDIFYANLYGPTEITDVCTYYIVNEDFADNEPLPIGIACENTKTLILKEDNTKAEIGEIGELCILGTGLALGYFNEPEITSKAFMQNPLNKKYRELIYRTGDLVFENNKNLIIYLGRKDSQIKHKGNRIELGEIEVAAQSLEEIEKACVLYDDINAEIVLFAEICGDVKDREILNKMKRLLQNYMIPGKIIRLEKIPLNANGKLDRVYLKSNYIGK